MGINLNFGFMLQFSEDEIEQAKLGVLDRKIIKLRIQEAIRVAYERPIWVHFRADPKALRKAAREIINGDEILTFNLETMIDEAIKNLAALPMTKEERWWRED